MSISRQSRKQPKTRRPSPKKRVQKDKPVNWSKVLKAAKEQEQREDAGKVIALVEELYHILCVKNKLKSHRKVRVEDAPK